MYEVLRWRALIFQIGIGTFYLTKYMIQTKRWRYNLTQKGSGITVVIPLHKFVVIIF